MGVLRDRGYWIAGIVCALLAGAYLGYALWRGEEQVFSTGASTDGHHPIEERCEACHTRPFGGEEALQGACIECHGDELKASEDSHPKRLFTDPRNAEQLAILDARRCTACHREHRPALTRAMGVTISADHCSHCHTELSLERPSHRDLSPESCEAAGCHNYHDNTALYEDFLAKHLDEAETFPQAALPRRNHAEVERLLAKKPRRALTLAEHDAPEDLAPHPRLLADWARTAHARGGANCRDCHSAKDPKTALTIWRKRPDEGNCRECHREEVEGFLSGKHGMRQALGLPPPTPAMARQPMRPGTHDKALGCNSCHKAHRYDTRLAAVEACLGCHDDRHSRSYKASPHFRLWLEEGAGRAVPGSGVSCATCHLPRKTHRRQGLSVTRIEHNQNENLRPNEKMVRGVCLSCHGLAFSLDALADRSLIERNFKGRPQHHIRSLEMARERVIQTNLRSEKRP